jgi:hypothetical protein
MDSSTGCMMVPLGSWALTQLSEAYPRNANL